MTKKQSENTQRIHVYQIILTFIIFELSQMIKWKNHFFLQKAKINDVFAISVFYLSLIP